MHYNSTSGVFCRPAPPKISLWIYFFPFSALGVFGLPPTCSEIFCGLPNDPKITHLKKCGRRRRTASLCAPGPPLGPRSVPGAHSLPTHSAAVCCSLLQSATVCCSLLQSAAVCCSLLQSVAVCYSLLQAAAVCYRLLQSVPLPSLPLSWGFLNVFLKAWPPSQPA